MKVALAQISPIWLNQKQTIRKISHEIDQASKAGAHLVVFGEGLLPGYPYWLSETGGASFDDSLQKEMFAIYQQNAVNVAAGDLTLIQKSCQENNISCYLGCIEKSIERAGFSLYCSLVYINNQGEIKSVHRKLVPTYEERLVWANGDGNGLVCHEIEGFHVGGLNCWENWMPLSRTALYAQGESLHIAVWPGSDFNTRDITRFIARESRSYVISVSSLLERSQIPKELPVYDAMSKSDEAFLGNGGSCIASPDGEWLLPPQINEEGLFFAEIEIKEVAKERQNFDPTGHNSRPDLKSLKLNTQRQVIL